MPLVISNTEKVELGSKGANIALVERCSAQAAPMLHGRCVHVAWEAEGHMRICRIRCEKNGGKWCTHWREFPFIKSTLFANLSLALTVRDHVLLSRPVFF